jgi:hypothetical protein
VALDSNKIAAWEATAIDGTELNSRVAETFERVNDRGGAARLAFVVGERTHHVSCGPGESIHLFTRRGILDALSPSARQVNMPIAEIRRSGAMIGRLYVHPEHGIIFSSQDLNL